MDAQTITQINAELTQVSKYQCLLAMSLYKQLCDAQDAEMKRVGAKEEDLITLDESYKGVVEYLQARLGYFISFENSFRGWIKKSVERNFDIGDVYDATHAFERLVIGDAKDEYGAAISKLRETLKELGQTSPERTSEVSMIMWTIEEN